MTGPEPPRAAPTRTGANRQVALDVTDDQVDRWLWLAGGRATVWLVALELWDAVEKLATISGMAELKRSNRLAPDFT